MWTTVLGAENNDMRGCPPPNGVGPVTTATPGGAPASGSVVGVGVAVDALVGFGCGSFRLPSVLPVAFQRLHSPSPH